jgi:hypothetical protein
MLQLLDVLEGETVLDFGGVIGREGQTCRQEITKLKL